MKTSNNSIAGYTKGEKFATYFVWRKPKEVKKYLEHYGINVSSSEDAVSELYNLINLDKETHIPNLMKIHPDKEWFEQSLKGKTPTQSSGKSNANKPTTPFDSDAFLKKAYSVSKIAVVVIGIAVGVKYLRS